MIGDWVLVNDIEHKSPMQVAGIKKVSGELYAELANPYDAQDHCECIVSKVQGLPINREILLKNGFRSYPMNGDFRFRLTIDTIMLEVLLFADGLIKFSAVGGSRVNDMHLTLLDLQLDYVHELQHISLLCGVDLQWEVPGLPRGVCRICGCTETDPCWHPEQGYCSWVDEEETICSHCHDEAIASDLRTVHCVNSSQSRKMKILYGGTWWDVIETQQFGGLTVYGIEDEPGHIDWITNPKGIKYDNEED